MKGDIKLKLINTDNYQNAITPILKEDYTDLANSPSLSVICVIEYSICVIRHN